MLHIEPTKPRLYMRSGKWWCTDATGVSGSGADPMAAYNALRSYQARLQSMYRMESIRVGNPDLDNTCQGGFRP